ncbi:hypothetical protein CSB20_11700 [bacterium DOLZORAL124_64_63]|nr:MAG: hypothetical protein CSB20_11700 [bacterium DOLZORAL124_64_63]
MCPQSPKPPDSVSKVKVTLQNLKPDQQPPEMAIYALDHGGKILKKLGKIRSGEIAIDTAWQNTGPVLALGPDVEDTAKLQRDGLMQFRSRQAIEHWIDASHIDVPADFWQHWFLHKICVSGTAQKCTLQFPYPRPSFSIAAQEQQHVVDHSMGLSWIHPPIHSCKPMCDGIVEVIEHRCCCRDFPHIIPVPDWREICQKFPELCEGLQQIPDIPIPDQPDWGLLRKKDPKRAVRPERSQGTKPCCGTGEAMAKRALKHYTATKDLASTMPISRRVMNDLQEMQALPAHQRHDFVTKRPHLHHLFCECRQRKVGETTLNPDGSFRFCYPRGWLALPNTVCRTTYTFLIKQWNQNQWVVVYNGMLTHDYFTRDETALLKTYHPLARACVDPEPVDVDNDKPFVLLDRIGGTRAHRLMSPLQQSELGINAPLPPNAGLADPSTPSDTVDGLKDCPWAMTLSIRLMIDEGMKALGAKYYRIGRVAADSNGNPASNAPPVYFDAPRSWSKVEYVDGMPTVMGEALGPVTVGNENSLYKIPYWSDEAWLSNQYHQSWDTTDQPGGKYLLIVEIFDASGNRLRPSGSTGAGTEKAFDFLHWKTPVEFDKVPFAALTHLFWTDNTSVYGDIVDIRKGGVPSTAQCQFLSGEPADNLSLGLRAYHKAGPPGNSFLYRWRLWWQRGLNGPYQLLDSGTQNAPPSMDIGEPQPSSSISFHDLLDGLSVPKCSFSVHLHAEAKHTNGNKRLREYDRWDQASFAAELLPED